MPREQALPLFSKRRRAVVARAPQPSELQIQIAVVQHLRYGLTPGWKFWHTPNGELRDKRTAAKLKAMGTMAGVPDLVLISPTGMFYGLELKAKGRPTTDDQDKFIEHCRAMAWPIAVRDTLDGALATLIQWGALKPNHGWQTS